MSTHEVAEGLIKQGTDESLAYSITTTNWASDPTSPSVAVFDENLMTDVTSIVMPLNSPSVTNDVISLSLLKNLTEGAFYRVEVRFTVDSNIYEAFFRVRGVR